MKLDRVAAGFAAVIAITAPAAAQVAPAADAAAAPAAAPAGPSLAPAYSGPLAQNANPISLDLGDGFGKIYVSGILSGVGSTQSHPIFGDDKSFADIDNAHIYIQKVDGVFQFLVQAGAYSFPSIGFPYLKVGNTTKHTFGYVPQAFIKIAPSSNFSIQAGLLPTLIGAEGIYTYQNMNIDRGLLWGQENIINRGVQANLTLGKVALSLSLNDGFFSGKYNWLTGSAAYTIDASNTLAFVAGGSFKKSYKSTFATNPVYNNSSIYNIIYTYSSGPMMIQPYFQYTHIPSLPLLGTTSADTYSGAVLARYNLTSYFSVPVRFEYIDTKGAAATAPNLLYGVGSNAFTFTITPTFTYKMLFARAEFNIVKAGSVAAGSGFGSFGTNKSQTRGLVEVGFIF